MTTIEWMDKSGCCKICGGEIPSGHLKDCHILKLEIRIQELEAPDGRWIPLENYQRIVTENERLQQSIDTCGTEEGICYAKELELKDTQIKRFETMLEVLKEELHQWGAIGDRLRKIIRDGLGSEMEPRPIVYRLKAVQTVLKQIDDWENQPGRIMNDDYHLMHRAAFELRWILDDHMRTTSKMGDQ